jgi:NADPH:quinone reductase-like Zn-dependent oxidoreductase
MRAVIFDNYGPPEVLRLAEVETPVPNDDEVRVKIQATTVNRTDTGFRRPEYLAVRVVGGLFKPRRKILGSEFAGVVDLVGKAVTKFKPGDRVFGLRTIRFGAHAEFLCLKQNDSIATMPEGRSFQEAAAVCDGMMYANNYLRRVNFQSGTSILINGATGSIGSAALQIAKSRGAAVTVTCKTSAVDLMRSLGADDVVDYTKEDFTKLDRRFDVVLDSVGKSTFARCRPLLKPKGIYYSTELGPWSQNPLLALVTPLFGGRRVGFPIPTDSQRDIEYFKSLIEKGKYRAVIDRTYPLDQIVDATRYVETGEKVGNVVVMVVPTPREPGAGAN